MAESRSPLVVAMPVYRGRISPLFEAARHLLVTELVPRRERARREVDLGPGELTARLDAVLDSGAELLVCGAIRRSSRWHLGRHGMWVWPGVVGDVDELVHTLVETGTLSDAFVMPGVQQEGRNRRLWSQRKAVGR